MTVRSTIKFIRHGKLVELSDVGPNETVLDYLRLRERSVGTKEGCCEGDCGACTVAIGRIDNNRIVYQPVNSCIQLLGSLDGTELVTVEDLAADDGTLHPVQAAMVEAHGSQCGFCTPGFIMSMFVLHQQEKNPDRQTINKALAGNLCRCTGYRPIASAMALACQTAPEPRDMTLLSLLNRSGDIFIGDQTSFFASPASEASLARLYAAHRDAVMVAGATDVGLWITKHLRALPKIICLARVAELQGIKETDDALSLGAGVTY
ncbi:MAG TPA: 2Fe-2S iron-sulfur cluster binding domain-containing protein, partial [Rhizobiales bacterium]|nr:2Fe-2S iron-sulfur cluster binding domain-containing protein [Hyphomicrobiales bacterium]